MSYVLDPDPGTNWTAADLVDRFGPIPLSRVRQDPPPGTATEADVVRIRDREDRLCELVDCTLVEKTVGTYESYLALTIGRLLGNYVVKKNLGLVLGADGMLRLAPGLVRVPDVSFISWNRLPDRKIPDQAIADLVPDLAVEVISPGNTQQEMDRKVREYFEAGVTLVWYIYPRAREARTYGTADDFQLASEDQALDGANVVPGFTLPLSDLFADPSTP